MLGAGLYVCSQALGGCVRQPCSLKIGQSLFLGVCPEEGSLKRKASQGRPLLGSEAVSLVPQDPCVTFSVRIPRSSESTVSSLPLLNQLMARSICWVFGAIRTPPPYLIALPEAPTM